MQTVPTCVKQIQRANAAKLADLIDRLLPEQFDMGTFGKVTMKNLMHKRASNNLTVACAIGWAAMSGEFPGLGYYIADSKHGQTLVPVVNGIRSDWPTVAHKYFGIQLYYGLFSGVSSYARFAAKYPERAKRVVAAALRRYSQSQVVVGPHNFKTL